MKPLLLSALILGPLTVFAQDAPSFGYITGLVNSTQGILNLLIPLVVTIAVILFFWGLAVFILNAGDPEKRAEGRNIMIWGIVALFVIVAVWGLVGLLASIIGVEEGIGTQQEVPGVVAPGQ